MNEERKKMISPKRPDSPPSLDKCPPFRKRTFTETSDVIFAGLENLTHEISSSPKKNTLLYQNHTLAGSHTRNTFRKSTFKTSQVDGQIGWMSRSKSKSKLSGKRSTLPPMKFRDYFRDFETKRKVKQELLQSWKAQEKMFLKFFSDPRRLYLKKEKKRSKE